MRMAWWRVKHVRRDVGRPWLIFWATVHITAGLALLGEFVYLSSVPYNSSQLPWWTIPVIFGAVLNGFLGTVAVASYRASKRGFLPGCPFPVRHQAEPIRGYKMAKLLYDEGEIVFEGAVTYGVAYRVDDRAHCYRVPHRPADPDCSCGFYAMKRMSYVEPFLHGEDVLLEVELFGRVIVCERGYRAERQRVLSVTIERRCIFCSREAAGVISWSVNRYIDEFIGPMLPVCEQDSAAGENGLVTLSDLAGRLGTEVRWAASI